MAARKITKQTGSWRGHVILRYESGEMSVPVLIQSYTDFIETGPTLGSGAERVEGRRSWNGHLVDGRAPVGHATVTLRNGRSGDIIVTNGTRFVGIDEDPTRD